MEGPPEERVTVEAEEEVAAPPFLPEAVSMGDLEEDAAAAAAAASAA